MSWQEISAKRSEIKAAIRVADEEASRRLREERERLFEERKREAQEKDRKAKEVLGEFRVEKILKGIAEKEWGEGRVEEFGGDTDNRRLHSPAGVFSRAYPSGHGYALASDPIEYPGFRIDERNLLLWKARSKMRIVIDVDFYKIPDEDRYIIKTNDDENHAGGPWIHIRTDGFFDLSSQKDSPASVREAIKRHGVKYGLLSVLKSPYNDGDPLFDKFPRAVIDVNDPQATTKFYAGMIDAVDTQRKIGSLPQQVRTWANGMFYQLPPLPEDKDLTDFELKSWAAREIGAKPLTVLYYDLRARRNRRT